MTVFRRFLVVGAAVCACGATPGALLAQQSDSARIAEVERRLEAMTRELERLRLGQDVVLADTTMHGLGPAASKVYRVGSGVSIGGYGELLYENFAGTREDDVDAGVADRFDALRAIVYVGYKFTDRLLFNSEIEIEHASEISLEFAYLDYLITEDFGVRGGMLLAPLGFVNELHEPPVFLGTERSVTENRIIPTTWRENGVGVFGGNEQLAWRAYVMNSFDGAGFDGSGLRGGRQKGAEALAEDLGVAARVDWVGTPGVLVGASGFIGETAQGAEVGGTEIGGQVRIWDLHAEYARQGVELRALVAGASVDDAAELNTLNGLAGADGIGTGMLGWYVQGGYDVLRSSGSTHQLIPFARYEEVNTQRDVAAGFTADPANDLTVTSLGVAWKPVPQVAVKTAYQIHSNAASTGVNQWNVQIGWLF